MSEPNIPPDIARKIAAMRAAPPAAAGPAPAAKAAAPHPAAVSAGRPTAAPARAPGGAMKKVLLAGWVVALVAGAIAAAESYLFAAHEKSALAEQAQQYEAQLARLKEDSAAALKKVQDDATAQQQVLQADLDFQKMPELPLKTVFRGGGVLYVENESDEPFACKVRLFRPIGAVTREVDFSIKSRAFNDMGAIEDWVFAKGDKVDFVKPGYKPRSLVVP